MKIAWFFLPGINTTRPDNKNIERDVATRALRGASESGVKGVFEDSGPDGLKSRPTINLFEQWEEGARNYSFPKSLLGCMHLGPCH